MFAQLACILEATARKPGNVHRFSDFEDAHYLDFLVSATALGRNLTPDRVRRDGLGRAILGTVEETVRLVGHNTNLGMILLLAPLAGVEGTPESRDYASQTSTIGQIDPGSTMLRAGVSRLLDRSTVADVKAVYQAIRLARPGGLGSAPEQDVAQEPTVTLLEAMRLAGDRDAIARQYATGYEDVFEIGLPTLRDAIQAGRPLETAIVLAHLALMAGRPDTLIARKCGVAVAEESARRAAVVRESGWPDAPGSVDELEDLDAWLRADGHDRNPGATADLVAAAIFAGLWCGTIALPEHINRPGWDGGDSFR